jgi:hypothetical protein
LQSSTISESIIIALAASMVPAGRVVNSAG